MSEIGVPTWAQSAEKPTYTLEDLGMEFDLSEGLSIGGVKLDAQHIGAMPSTYTPTATEISSALSSATPIMKALVRSNMGLGSLATKSSITSTELADELKAMQEAVNCLVAAQDTTFVSKLDGILETKNLAAHKYGPKLDDYVTVNPNPR